MGGRFSKHFGREQQTKAVSSSDGGKSSGQGATSIMELIKPECLKKKKMNKNKEKRIRLNIASEKTTTKSGKLTLEDWLLASPGPSMKRERFNGGELYVLKQFSKRVHPSSARIQEAAATTSTAGDCSVSYSLEASSVGAASLISRSQCGKPKKRVSFKLPEKADIIMFYSPPETLGLGTNPFNA